MKLKLMGRLSIGAVGLHPCEGAASDCSISIQTWHGLYWRLIAQ